VTGNCAPGRNFAVVYDGNCNVCKKITGVLERWDRNHELELLPDSGVDRLLDLPISIYGGG